MDNLTKLLTAYSQFGLVDTEDCIKRNVHVNIDQGHQIQDDTECFFINYDISKRYDDFHWESEEYKKEIDLNQAFDIEEFTNWLKKTVKNIENIDARTDDEIAEYSEVYHQDQMIDEYRERLYA